MRLFHAENASELSTCNNRRRFAIKHFVITDFHVGDAWHRLKRVLYDCTKTNHPDRQQGIFIAQMHATVPRTPLVYLPHMRETSILKANSSALLQWHRYAAKTEALFSHATDHEAAGPKSKRYARCNRRLIARQPDTRQAAHSAASDRPHFHLPSPNPHLRPRSHRPQMLRL